MNTEKLLQLKGLQIIHHNVRSIFHKIDTIQNDFVRDCMDILCFSETWLNYELNDELVGLNNFSLLRNDIVYGRGV